jgi:methyl-accepting chemotaxis protein
MFKNLKLGSKVIGTLAVLVVIVLITGIVGIANINKINKADLLLYKNITMPITQLDDIAVNFQRTRVNLLKAFQTQDSTEKQTILNSISTYDEGIHKIIPEFEKTILSDEVKTNFDEFKNDYESFRNTSKKVIDLVNAKRDKEAADLLNGDGQKQGQVVNDILQKIIDLEADSAKKASEANNTLSNHSTVSMMIIIIIGMMAAGLLGTIFVRNVANIIKSILSETQNLTESCIGGKLDVRGE